ncbi:MAG TPA: sulfate adenylyltransferase subunit CysN [Gammaproteobacteria bacterium]|nr:sulfate adenylyltransferase subunit CysN [Gammaproteobacteria bacterium]
MNHSGLIATDIDAYLKQHEQKELLRFLTCGSVDDGKSTLIGRLLHDSKMIYEDQLAAIKSDSVKHGTTGGIDLALLVDGLQAEREQGITIDVAYRYFSTDKRKFIIADTPGHEQYTRNMATGASTCDLAIILIDARHGVMTQTRRHTYIASLLGIRHVVVAINKMDLMGFEQPVFERIKADYLAFAGKLGIPDIRCIPISALNGDNIVNRSERMGWYQGQPLMEILETVQIHRDRNLSDFRFPVQFVNRPNLNFRGFCGTIASGLIKAGDAVTVLPSRRQSKVKSIIVAGENASEAFAGQAVTLTLKDEIDISRGDMIVHSGAEIAVSNALKTQLIWMSENELQPGREYWFKFASKLTPGSVRAIDYKVNVNTQEHSPASSLGLNDIAVIDLTLTQPVTVDPYIRNRATGAFIIIDRLSNVTVGGGMVIEALQSTLPEKTDKPSLRNEVQALLQQPLDDAGLAVALKKLLGGIEFAKTSGANNSGKSKARTAKKRAGKAASGKSKKRGK